MNPTLDTDAIRKRFSEAIVGIRADGSMAVLVPTVSYMGLSGETPAYLNLCDGYSYALSAFPTLIRPGDECEVKLRSSIKWKRAKYFGFHAGHFSYFMASTSDMVTAWDSIRPLPGPVANPELEQARKLVEEARQKLSEAEAKLAAASK